MGIRPAVTLYLLEAGARAAGRAGHVVVVVDALRASATTTTAYDVTYTMDGEERVVRMDERPSVDRFRVVDGEVITKG